METETVDNDMAAHIEGSRTDTDSVDRDTETNFNIYLITHNVEEPIKDDKEEEEADAWEEKKPKTNKVEKITWDWELCNSSKPIWIRKPNDIEQDEYDEFYKSITKDKNGPIKTSSSGRSSPPKSSSESLRTHMGAEAPYSFKEVSGGPPYCKLTTRHHIFWYYVSPNQTCKVLGDFGPKS